MELFQHNRTAYDNALAMMVQTGKAAIIHPTGTGKSFIAFQLALATRRNGSAGCLPVSISSIPSWKTWQMPTVA